MVFNDFQFRFAVEVRTQLGNGLDGTAAVSGAACVFRVDAAHVGPLGPAALTEPIEEIRMPSMSKRTSPLQRMRTGKKLRMKT